MANQGFITFNRPPRIQRTLPVESVEIPLPTDKQFKGSFLEWTILLLPILLALLTMGSMVLLTIMRPNSSWIYLLTTIVMSLGFLVTGAFGIAEKLTRDRHNQKEYSEILNKYENILKDYRSEQQVILNYLYPSLQQIFDWPYLPQPPRLWERRPGDPDFLKVKMGLGSIPSTITVNKVKSDRNLPQLERAIALSKNFQEVPEVPYPIDFNEVAFLGVVGRHNETAAFIRSIVCHLAAHHDPQTVKILATYSPEHSNDWAWLGWLPHTRVADSQGNEMPLLASQRDQVDWLCNSFVLETLKARKTQAENKSRPGDMHGQRQSMMLPAMVWIVDDFELVQDEPAIRMLFEVGAELGIYLITSSNDSSNVPEQCRAIAELRQNRQLVYSLTGKEGKVDTLLPELATVQFCEEYALRMSPVKLKAASEKGDIPSSLRLLEILGFDPAHGEAVDPLKLWNRSSAAQLKVPMGRVFGGQIRDLDISDKGQGPHGLIAGTTGSGKSVLFQTVICSLAMYNHPDNLNFILGDFKGGATINPFKNLPHVVGMLSNHDLTIVERAMTSIFSELKRREKLLEKEVVSHIRDYQKKIPSPEVPMPYLVVMLDEFAELKEQAPDFIDKVVNIARKGRTLGVHVILATQKPAGVVTGQLNSNTKFRICLRVETPEDSNDMLGRKDAAMLSKDQPGRAFFKVGNDIFEQFQVANTEIPFAPMQDENESEKLIATLCDPNNWRISPVLMPKPRSSRDSKNEAPRWMDFDEITAQCLAASKRTVIRNKHKPWLDPMGDRYYLRDSQFLGNRGFDEKALSWSIQPPYDYGVAPIALVDNVVEQKQEPLFMNLSRDGSYCISGLAVSGKTMALYSMLTALILTHSPDELQIYLVDMGNTLKPFAGLPNTVQYIPMTQMSSLKEVFKQLYQVFQERRIKFAEKGVLDMASYRAIAQPGEKLPYIFIAFDNYASIRHSLPFDAEHLKGLVREGRQYGMHVAITMDRAQDFEYGRMAEQFFQVALRQAREDISFPVPRNMVGSWNERPGRGFIKGPPNNPPLEVHFLLPFLGEPDVQVKNIETLVTKMQKAARKNPAWAVQNSATAPAAAKEVTEKIVKEPSNSQSVSHEDIKQLAESWFKLPAKEVPEPIPENPAIPQPEPVSIPSEIPQVLEENSSAPPPSSNGSDSTSNPDEKPRKEKKPLRL